MELRRAVEKRRMLEIELRDFVAKKCAEFEQEVGLNITDVSIEMQEVNEMSSSKDKKIITGCILRVEI
jgi:xylose isomerase